MANPVSIHFLARDVQLNLKVLWDGHLARPDWAGKMPTPQLIKGCNRKVAHRVRYQTKSHRTNRLKPLH